MKLMIEIKMDNAAFSKDASIEAARILRSLADRIEGHPHFSAGYEQALHDANGKLVGSADVYA